MKSFKTFRLDPANHVLWCEGDRVPVAPKSFDVLAYLVEHAGRVVTQGEILEVLWSETYVNPEILRKYILEIRRSLGDRPDKPEFIETVPKRGYRFVAAVTEMNVDKSPGLARPSEMEANITEAEVTSETAHSKRDPSGKGRLWKAAIVLVLVFVGAAIGG